jgi:uncharacterized protein YyaL (SSP411 family)
MNRLSDSASSYLRSAAHQPVFWQPWSDAAFAQAQREQKPVLLDIGAVWCHWCHVMDRESYEDAAIAAFINEHFVAVKVDRDERPDVDARYQAAVSSISGQGGWPLTAFLTPDGKPFFGGTYFPPADRYGRPGFPRVLAAMADVFQNKKAEMEESATSVMAAVAYNEGFAGRSADLQPELLQKIISHATGQFDPRHGGFGSQPKFPHPAALDLLLDRAARTGDAATRDAALVTLHKMAEGGIFDQLAGGFHRYSVDERWVVPHFEKMSYDNSELLRCYVHAFQTFADASCGRAATEIVRWMDDVLSDRELGGFYASQDADISLDDDGDYFTWTRAEAAEVLEGTEFLLAAQYLHIGEVGDMQHDPARNVLHTPAPLAEVAASLQIPLLESETLLASAKAKLLARRAQRSTPFVDKTLYTGWNGLAISAYLEAARALSLPRAKEFALRSLDRALASAWSAADGLRHVIAYGEATAKVAPVAGMLDDYAFLAQACLDAWETTAELRYYESARAICDAMIARFYDKVTPGFFDAEADGNAIGALAVRRKPLQDSPTPAGNPAAASVLLRLHSLGGGDGYREIARDTLESFAGVVEHFGLYAGTYGLALTRALSPPVQVAVVGEDAPARALEIAARTPWLASKVVVRMSRAQAAGGALPPAFAETLPHLPTQQSVAIVCTGRECLPPVTEVDELAAQIASLADVESQPHPTR